MRAIQQTEFGGPEVLELVDLPVPEAGDGEVLIRVSRAGMNFADTHQRDNDYLAAPAAAARPGRRGRRACARTPASASSRSAGPAATPSTRTAPEALTFPIPDGVDDGTALALLIQGLTAWHLYRTCGRVGAGESVASCAAAGGVGSLAVQLGQPMGAGRVIAHGVDARRSATLALELGADVAIDADARGAEGAPRSRPTTAARSTSSSRWPAARSSTRALAALAPFGRLVDLRHRLGRAATRSRRGALMRRSRAVVGFWLMHCIGRPEMVDEALADLFARAARGELRAVVGATYPLAEARQAQIDLAERRTTGKLLLDPTGRLTPAPRARLPPSRGRFQMTSAYLVRVQRRDRLRRPRPLRHDAARAAGRRLRAAQPDPGAGHPRAPGGPRHDRPGPDGLGQDRRLRPADDRARRSGRARGAGARAHADARAVHPGHPGAARLRPAQGRRRRRRLRRRADPLPAGAAARRRPDRRRHRRARARPHPARLADPARLPLRRPRRGRRDARPRLPGGRRADPHPDAQQPPDRALQRDDAAADPRAGRPLPLRPGHGQGQVGHADRRHRRAVLRRREVRRQGREARRGARAPSAPTRPSSSRARRSAATSSTAACATAG